jgi:hypothetical protein
VPWNALSFLFFNSFKMMYESVLSMAPNQRDTMALGALGGGLAAIIMTPVDVVKTRLMLQVSPLPSSVRVEARANVSMFQCECACRCLHAQRLRLVLAGQGALGAWRCGGREH